MKQRPAYILILPKKDDFQMQDITILNDKKKATKLGMKVFRDKQNFKT